MIKTLIKKAILLLWIFPLLALAQSSPEPQLTIPSQQAIHTILLVVALQDEANPILKKLNLQPLPPFGGLPMKAYGGKVGNLSVYLVQNGADPRSKAENIGSQAATLSTYVGIQRFHPDLVISIGTAGAIEKNGAQLKQLYVSKKIYFFDRRIQVPDYKEYGLGDYSSPTLAPSMLAKTKLQPGIICTGDSFDENATDYQMMLQLGCHSIEMEAAGVAWASQLMHTPMLAIKGITDYAEDQNGIPQFLKNFSAVTNDLAEQLDLLLQQLAMSNDHKTTPTLREASNARTTTQR